MKRTASLVLACLLLTCAFAALADSPSSLAWVTPPAVGDTSVRFTIGSLGDFFYHVWITRDGQILAYFNSDGSAVPFTSLENTFDFINDTDLFTNAGFTGILTGDTVSVRVGERTSLIEHTISAPTPEPSAPPIITIPADQGGTTTNNPMPDYQKGVVARVKEWANVRSGPGTDYDISGRATLGEDLLLIQWNKAETWCKVYYNDAGSVGWLYHKFIKVVD